MSDRYEVLTGMDYRPNGDASLDEERHEPGDIVDNLPEASVSWLLADGYIRPAPEAPPAGAKKPAKGGA